MNPKAIKLRMRQIFQADRSLYLDSSNEVNMTLLAENTAHDLNHDEWLDDSTHAVWDCAVEISDEWDKERE